MAATHDLHVVELSETAIKVEGREDALAAFADRLEPGRSRPAQRAPRPAATWCRFPRSAPKPKRRASYRALQAKYPAVLGARRPTITRADLGKKGIFFRTQVGPFAAAEEAGKICNSLKAAGGQCIVQRN